MCIRGTNFIAKGIPPIATAVTAALARVTGIAIGVNGKARLATYNLHANYHTIKCHTYCSSTNYHFIIKEG